LADASSLTVKACGCDSEWDLPGLYELIEASRAKQPGGFDQHQARLMVGVLVGEEDYDSPDFTDIAKLPHIALDAPPGSLVAVTHHYELDKIRRLMDQGERFTVQLHCRPGLSPDDIARLRDEFPNHPLWSVVHDEGLDSVEETVYMADERAKAGVDGFVVDSLGFAETKEGKTVRQVGGTGILVNSNFARKFRGKLKQKNPLAQVFLAGGLNPRNVAERYAYTEPDGVDANTGLNIPGDPRRRKDLDSVSGFYNQSLWAAFGPSSSGLMLPRSS